MLYVPRNESRDRHCICGRREAIPFLGIHHNSRHEKFDAGRYIVDRFCMRRRRPRGDGREGCMTTVITVITVYQPSASSRCNPLVTCEVRWRGRCSAVNISRHVCITSCGHWVDSRAQNRKKPTNMHENGGHVLITPAVGVGPSRRCDTRPTHD